MDIVLKRLGLLIAGYHLLLLLVLWHLFHQLYYQSFIIIGLASFAIFFSTTSYITYKKAQYATAGLLIFILMWFQYDLVGHINHSQGGFPLKDDFFLDWDISLYGQTSADFFEQKFQFLGYGKGLWYDFLILCYIAYYLFPFYGLLLFYFAKDNSSTHSLPCYLLSIILLLLVSYTTYLFVPVTGPQYFWPPFLEKELPLTPLGTFIFTTLAHFQSNLIDCFPSVHSALSLMVSMWMVKLRFPTSLLLLALTFCIMLATVVLRFHYTLDVLFAFVYVALCYLMARQTVFVFIKNLPFNYGNDCCDKSYSFIKKFYLFK